MTGAGIGMKAETTRNFEAGILTDDPEIAEQAMNQFDDVGWGNIVNRVNVETIAMTLSYKINENELFFDLCHQLAEVFVFFAQ